MPHNLQAFKLKACYPGFYILQTYSPVHHLSAPLVQAFVHGCYCTQSYPTIIKVLLMFFLETSLIILFPVLSILLSTAMSLYKTSYTTTYLALSILCDS